MYKSKAKQQNLSIMENLVNVATQMYNEVLNGKSGGTFNHLTGNKIEAIHGYFVGIRGIQVPKSYFLNPKYPINTLVDVLISKGLNMESDLIGYWIKDDIIYIDSVKHTYSFNTAVYLAKKHNQLAIYDCKLNIDIEILNK